MPTAIAIARAASFADADGWIDIEDGLPTCSRSPNSLGVEILIYPRSVHGDSTAFYGRRFSATPQFYKSGSILHGVLFWQYLPNVPAAAPKPSPDRKERQTSATKPPAVRDGLPGKLGTQKALDGLPGKLGSQKALDGLPGKPGRLRKEFTK